MAANERLNHSGLKPGVDIDMEAAGARLRIPRDEWDNPAMQELVGFIVRVDELQRDLFDAVLTNAQENLPGFLDGTHILAARYHTAEQLLRVLHAVLHEGLSFWETKQEPGSANFDYLTEKLENALEPYGLVVTPRE